LLCYLKCSKNGVNGVFYYFSDDKTLRKFDAHSLDESLSSQPKISG
jgi:YHS domain-containing protein